MNWISNDILNLNYDISKFKLIYICVQPNIDCIVYIRVFIEILYIVKFLIQMLLFNVFNATLVIRDTNWKLQSHLINYKKCDLSLAPLSLINILSVYIDK